MKFSLTLGQRRPLDRQTAWGCLTTNLLGLPGLGSLAAGRRSGYAQMAFALVGLAITSVYGIRCLLWLTSSSNGLHDLEGLPGEYFDLLWAHTRGALLGMAVFLCGWLWGLISGMSILAEARSNEKTPARRIPPKI